MLKFKYLLSFSSLFSEWQSSVGLLWVKIQISIFEHLLKIIQIINPVQQLQFASLCQDCFFAGVQNSNQINSVYVNMVRCALQGTVCQNNFIWSNVCLNKPIRYFLRPTENCLSNGRNKRLCFQNISEKIKLCSLKILQWQLLTIIEYKGSLWFEHIV